MKKLASSPTLAGLEKLLNQYYYSSTYKILDDLTIINSKGVFTKVIVKKVKNRYILFEF